MLMHHVSWYQVASCRRRWLRMFIFWPLCPQDLVSQIPGSQITTLWPQKWRFHPSLTPVTTEVLSVSHGDTSTHALALYLSHLSSTTWRKTNKSKSYIAVCHTSESKGGSSKGQSWYKQDAGQGKEERPLFFERVLPLFFVLSWTF